AHTGRPSTRKDYTWGGSGAIGSNEWQEYQISELVHSTRNIRSSSSSLVYVLRCNRVNPLDALTCKSRHPRIPAIALFWTHAAACGRSGWSTPPPSKGEGWSVAPPSKTQSF